MNAAWGTMQERETVVLNLTETHKTVKNIKARGAFTVSIADAAHVIEADYFGVESGNRTADKFTRSGLTVSKAPLLSTSSHFVSNVNLLNIRMANMAVE
jgi:flavin reductase (DIM6/NTAB) family NADH-FMN oxidoreductase RutF